MAKEDLLAPADEAGAIKVFEPVSKDPADQLGAIMDQIANLTQKPTAPAAGAPAGPTFASSPGRADQGGFWGFGTGSSFFDSTDTGPTRTQIILAGIGILAIGYFLLKGK